MKEKDYNWLDSQYQEYMRKDIFNILMNKNYLLIKLYKIIKCRKFALFIGRIFFFQARIINNFQNESKNTYDEILESIYKKLIDIIINSNICKLLENVKIKNISGFSFYNAFAFPHFYDNLLAVNTGIFFLSHTIVRSIELFLKGINENIKIPFLIKYYLLKNFVKTSEAIICENYLKSFSSIRLIASDDSLLTGIELFIVAHEYAHLIFKNINFNYSELKFGKYYDQEIINLITENEEIAADAFAIIVLKNYQLTLKDYSIALYSPQFIFKILSKYDELKFSSVPSKTIDKIQIL